MAKADIDIVHVKSVGADVKGIQNIIFLMHLKCLMKKILSQRQIRDTQFLSKKHNSYLRNTILIIYFTLFKIYYIIENKLYVSLQFPSVFLAMVFLFLIMCFHKKQVASSCIKLNCYYLHRCNVQVTPLVLS